jgi:EmrB/QacA subfamily drug resistance transporter
MDTQARVRNPWVVLATTSLAVFAVFLDTTILFVAFPSISVASMICGIAPTPGLLVLARILQAVGAAALVPASLALVLQTFPREKVPVAVAIWGAIAAVAGAAGPTLGALVVEQFGWRWAFYINLPVGLFSWIVGRRVLPEWREENPGRLPDPWGVALLASGLALTAYAIVQTEEWGWLDVRVGTCLALAAALVAAFIHRCSQVANPLLDLRLFEATSFRWANGGLLVFSIGFNAMFLGNVLFLTQVWGYSILRAGMAIALGPTIVACTAPFFGKLAGRVGQRRLLLPGGLMWAAGGAFLIATAEVGPDYLGTYLPAVCLTGLGVAMCLPQLSSAAVQGLPPAQFGAGSAVTQAVRNLGATLGVALVLAFTADATPATAIDLFHRVWWLLVASGIAVTVLSWRLPRPSPAVVPSAVPVVQAAQ